MKKVVALASLIVIGGSLGFVLAACGSGKAVSLGPATQQTGSTAGSDVTTTTSSATTGAGTVPTSTSFEVWFARGEQLVSERRTHSATPRVATTALQALLVGPTRRERASGDTTAIPSGTRLLGISIKNGVATVDLTSEYQAGGGSLSMQFRLGQVVYTLTQFPTVKTVRFALDGAPVNVFSSEGIVLDHPVGRSDYRNLLLGGTPAGSPLAGTWARVPAPPIAVEASLASVWTGTEMILYGVTGVAPDGNFLKAFNVAEAYNPATHSWRRLPSPPGPRDSDAHTAVWTGSEMLVWSPFVTMAFNPSTNHWRRLPRGHGGLVVWTGHELIGWGGGCCGDAFSDGVAYSPATKTWRNLAPSPLAGSQRPVGAWTGRELIVFVGDLDPNGKPWPAPLARAAAYNPATNSWRRIAPLPAPRNGATAVWDGREVLVVGGAGASRGATPASPATVGFAYDPATNRWRRLPAMESGRIGAAVVWTGRRLLLWGGSQTADAGPPDIPPHGLAYDPKANRWWALPQAPLLGRLDPTAVWTGHTLIVWGGAEPATPPGSGTHFFTDGAAFGPATP